MFGTDAAAVYGVSRYSAGISGGISAMHKHGRAASGLSRPKGSFRPLEPVVAGNVMSEQRHAVSTESGFAPLEQVAAEIR